MKNKRILSLLYKISFLFVLSYNLLSQTNNVGIGTTTPDSSAVLDLSSTTQGLLAPRMTYANRIGITNPKAGLIVYQNNTASNTLPGYYYYDGSNWNKFSYNGMVWILGGNYGNSDTTTFGNIDNKSIVIKTNNLQRMVIKGNGRIGLSSDPDTSAILDLSSATTKGFLAPRVSDTTSVVLPATGLLVYKTSAVAGYYYYDGSKWNKITTGTLTNGWSLTGNTGIDTTVNYFGTTDNKSILFKTNATQRMIVKGSGNIGIGTTTPSSIFHLYDANTYKTPPLTVEQSGSGDAAVRYKLTGSQAISEGIDKNDNNNYKITNTDTLKGTTYSDANLMMRVHTESSNQGIIDLNNQSRVRAYRSGSSQTIPYDSWSSTSSIVKFSAITFLTNMDIDTSSTNGNYWFQARAEGYYQVNARVEFDISNPDYTPGSYVGIAIYKAASGNSPSINLYSYGTFLGVQAVTPSATQGYVAGSKAPVVSDIIYLLVGERVQIRAYQNNRANGISIIQGQGTTYVSIHKIS